MGVQEFDFSSGKALNPNRKQAIVVSECDDASELLEGCIRQKCYKFLGKTTDLRQGLEWIRKFKVGVLFLDADLASVEVTTLLAILTEKAPNFNVILMTHSPTKELLTQGQAGGVAGFLVKPLDVERVDKTLTEIK